MDDVKTEVSIEIEAQSSIYNYVLVYAATFDSIKNYSTEYIEYDKIEKEEEKKYKIKLMLPYGISEIEFEGNIIKIEYKRLGNPVGLAHSASVHTTLKISTNGPIDILKKFISSAREYSSPQSKSYITVKIYKNFWTTLSKLPARDMDTIYLENDVKSKYLNDIQEFVKNEDEYGKYGIPYKRTYLFEGKPGTGKTSLIFATASMLKMNIGIINFGPRMDDVGFMNAVSSLPDNYILLIEDIDSLFVARESKGVSAVSFSGILNTLDGMGRRHRLITFITTNYVNKLDSALIRPGRIDYVITFSDATKEQIKEIFLKFRPNDEKIFDKFYKNVKKKNITIAMLQNFLFNYRNEKDIMSKIDDLNKMMNFYEKPMTKEIRDSMYL